MTSVPNVIAEGVNTIEWLSSADTVLAVPVYQRQYRWDVDKCARLLEDVRTVADRPEGETHFIGSVLSTVDRTGDLREFTLVDGQQRITTLMLLIAALCKALEPSDETLANELMRILAHPRQRRRVKLHSQPRQEDELARIVFVGAASQPEVDPSPMEQNYTYFLKEIRLDADRVWRGLQRLEHVAITLTDHANPQQVFESLNSTGVPLQSHELIHNYVLMGLSYDRQAEFEASVWVRIEEEGHSGPVMESFWRDYMIQRTGRDTEFGGEHGVYDVFRTQFPRLSVDRLRQLGDEWVAYSRIYRILLDPTKARDEDVEGQLSHLAMFGSASFPLVMAVYHDFECGLIDKADLLHVFEQVQSLYLRKMVVGETRDHLSAQLCRKLRRSGYPIRDLARRMPSDERIRHALLYRPLPHAGYVLQRVENLASLVGYQIEHIFPQTPPNTWSGDGIREWASFTEEERAKHREVLQTIGNLALLEGSLNAAAGNHSFQDKKPHYRSSRLPSTRQLGDVERWDLRAIEGRSVALTERFLTIWRRPTSLEDEAAEHLVPILDVPKKPGWYLGWKADYEYVKFGNEIWDVHDVKTLFKQVYKRLWDTRRSDIQAWSDRHNELIFKTKAWNGQWEPLDPHHYLFMGLFPQWMLADLQGMLDELNLAETVLIKFSTSDEA